MSAAIKTNAFLKPTADGMRVDASGGLYVPAEVLARFGDGDAVVGRKEVRMMLADRKAPVFNGPTAYSGKVRVPTADEEEEVTDLVMVELMAHANKMTPVDRDKVLDTIRGCTRRRGVSLVGVIGKPIVAVIVMARVQWWFGQGWYWQELSCFVHPDHRKSNHGADLLEFGKWASDQMSKDMGTRWHFAASVLASWRLHGKVALYRRRMHQNGAIFLYPPTPVGEHE